MDYPPLFSHVWYYLLDYHSVKVRHRIRYVTWPVTGCFYWASWRLTRPTCLAPPWGGWLCKWWRSISRNGYTVSPLCIVIVVVPRSSHNHWRCDGPYSRSRFRPRCVTLLPLNYIRRSCQWGITHLMSRAGQSIWPGCWIDAPMTPMVQIATSEPYNVLLVGQVNCV